LRILSVPGRRVMFDHKAAEDEISINPLGVTIPNVKNRTLVRRETGRE
jgi:hypothetical protein